MKRFILLSLLQTFAVLCAGDFILSSRQQSASLIVPDEAYRKALEDFAWHIGRVTGHSPALVQSEQGVKGAKVVFKVSQSQDIRQQDAFSFVFPDELTLQINCTQGSLQPALNRIMEDHAGIRFLMPEYCGTHLPRKSAVTIPRIPRSYKPSFHARDVWYTVDSSWSRHLSTETPGMHFSHEIWNIVFPTRHYDSVGYPEGVLPMHKGRRLTALPNPRKPAQFWQPCYSDMRAARLAAENIIKYADAHPEVTTVSLTINDNGGFCECEECRKLNGGNKVSQIGTVTVHNHSEVYFTWVNRVATLVAEKHPRLLMPCLAYSEVIQPPSFKLHPNVPVIITLDAYAITDPDVRKKNLKLIDAWSERATFIGCWDYAWGYGYALPRMYLKRQIELLRYLYRRNARTWFLEYEGADCHEGPKFYLYAKMLWDINVDPDAILKEWYELAVGPQAAPYLKSYFDHWEAYFAGPEVRKTAWFGSARYVYMTWGATNHMYGLKKGDLAKARRLMEKVVALAETPEQKQRAAIFMHRFEVTEVNATLHGAEPMPANGVVASWKDAEAICENIVGCAPFIKRKQELQAALLKEPGGEKIYKASSGISGVLNFNVCTAMAEQLCLLARHAGHTRVNALLQTIARTRELPEGIRQVAACLTGDGQYGNQFPEGEFEHDGDVQAITVSGTGAGTQRVVDAGKYGKGKVLRLNPGRSSSLTKVFNVPQNSRYLVTFRIFLPNGTSENFIRTTLFGGKDNKLIQWCEVSKNFVPAGQWVSLALLGEARDDWNELHFTLEMGNFESEQDVLLDDLKLMRLGDYQK